MYSCEYNEGYRLYTAKVIDLNDPLMVGRIKARPLPELKDIKDINLPWFKPYKLGNISETKWEHNPPPEDSIIYVLINSDWTSFKYCGNRIFEDLLDYATNIDSPLKELSELSDDDVTYKDLNWKLYEDGSLEFHNTSTGSHGFLHKSGSYSIYDTDGNMFVKPVSDTSFIIDNSKAQFEMTGDGEVIINNENGIIDLKTDGSVNINNGNLEILA